METTKILAVLSGLVCLAGFVPYLRAILKGDAKPAKASWVIWTSLDTITFAGMWIEGTLNGQMMAVIFGAWTTVVFALKYGKAGWTKLDKLCLFGATLGIVLWKAFDDPVFGIVISQIVIFFGSIPTFVSAWQYPSRENKLAWTLFWISCVLTIAAIPAWTLADAAQPITFFVVESVMMFILFVRPRFVEREM